MDKKTLTKGHIVIEDIKIGDIHYEYEYGCYIKSKVKTLPLKEPRGDDNYWTWDSIHINPDGTEGKIINYGVSDKYPYYGPNLYNTEAYFGFKQI